MTKKALSLFMALVLAVGLCPASALAASSGLTAGASASGDGLAAASPGGGSVAAQDSGAIVFDSGGCVVTVNNKTGLMTVAPAKGGNGKLPSAGDDWSGPYLWWQGNDLSGITTVKFSPGVSMKGSAGNMFSGMGSLETVDLSALDASGVTSMNCMFGNCPLLATVKLPSKSKTAKLTDMNSMFSSCSSLKTVKFPAKFTTSKVADMNSMFYDCSSLKKLDVSRFDTSGVSDMGSMFSGCSSFATLDLSGFDTQNVHDMSYMFNGCSGLKKLNVSGFDTSNVSNMEKMFGGCSGLEKLDLSGFDTSNVANMANMFFGCSSLTALGLSGFETSNVTSMENMFGDCSGLEKLDVSGFDTSNVTNMGYMFGGCSGLEKLDVSGFDTSAVGDYYGAGMSYMFENCRKLQSLDLSSFVISGKKVDTTDMLAGCGLLKQLKIGAKTALGAKCGLLSAKWKMWNGSKKVVHKTAAIAKNSGTKKYAGTWKLSSGAKNPMTISVNKIKIAASDLKKAAAVVARNKAFAIATPVGKVTFSKVSGSKKVAIGKQGKITVAKGTKKGNYRITVTAKAAGGGAYLPATKTLKVLVRVQK